MKKLNLNKAQRNIIALFTPTFIAIIAWLITNNVFDKIDSSCVEFGHNSAICRAAERNGRSIDISAFDFEDTWWVWLVAIIVIATFEYVLFGLKIGSKS